MQFAPRMDKLAPMPQANLPPACEGIIQRTLNLGIIEGLMLEAFGASDPGCVRANNEDYYLLAPTMGLYVVADGMGGAQGGEHASKLATETLWEVVHQSPSSAGAEILVEAFHEANHKVMEAAAADPALEGMGTTMVAALAKNGELWIASVGDSRAYLFDHGDSSRHHPGSDLGE